VILSSLGLDPIFSIHLSAVLSEWGAAMSELILPSESFSLAAIALGLALSAFIGFIFLSLLGYLLYGPLFESSPMMATPGKWLVGLTVVDLDCRQLSLPQAMLRTIAKGLSWLSCGVGFLSIGLTPTKQGLHDILARTQVVQQAQCSKTTIALVLGSLIGLNVLTQFFSPPSEASKHQPTLRNITYQIFGSQAPRKRRGCGLR
jgi:uncharacterized RDD family membrane protein YckC